MPIYEYQCTECGDTFEVFQARIGPDEEKQCPQCFSRACLKVSVPKMEPDNMWANPVYDESLGRTFNSRSEMKKYMSRNGIEDVDAGTARDVKRNARLREEKAAKESGEEVARIVQDVMA